MTQGKAGTAKRTSKAKAAPEAENTSMADATQDDAKSQEIADLKELVGDLVNEIKVMQEKHDNETSELRASIDSMLDNGENSPEMLQPESTRNDLDKLVSQSRLQQEQVKKKLDRIDAIVRKKDDDLEAGPKIFRVKLQGNPERRVGANGAIEAQAKYQHYFGITSVTDTSKRFEVEEVTGAVA